MVSSWSGPSWVMAASVLNARGPDVAGDDQGMHGGDVACQPHIGWGGAAPGTEHTAIGQRGLREHVIGGGREPLRAARGQAGADTDTKGGLLRRAINLHAVVGYGIAHGVCSFLATPIEELPEYSVSHSLHNG